MQVAFWSTVHGQSATTTNMMAISLMIALEYRFKMLITHNHHSKSTLETALLGEKYIEKEKEHLSDSGMDALARLIRFKNLDKSSVENYTSSLISNKLDILVGTKNANKDLYEKDFNQTLPLILSSISECYEMLFVDTASGENELSYKVLEQADYVIVCLNQNLNVLNEFLKEKSGEEKEKYFYLLGFYDSDSKYNISSLKRKFKLRANCMGAIPYSRAFADACNDGKAIEFFIKNIDADKDDIHFPFIEGVRKSTEMILEFIGVDLAVRKV